MLLNFALGLAFLTSKKIIHSENRPGHFDAKGRFRSNAARMFRPSAKREQDLEIRDNARVEERITIADDKAEQIGDRKHKKYVRERKYKRPSVVAEPRKYPLLRFPRARCAELRELHRLLQRLRTLCNERLEHAGIAFQHIVQKNHFSRGASDRTRMLA
jgi:hypothetical protein